jgi:CBS domain-containing protein
LLATPVFAIIEMRGGSSIAHGDPTETERIMVGASAGQPPTRPPRAPATVADVVRPALTTVEANGHLAAAAYLMKHAGETALVVIDDEHAKRPIGLITDADISQAVADGKDVNEVRIHELMTTDPTVIVATTSIHEAAEMMVTGHFRHLPVVSDVGLVGIVDIGDLCRALLDSTGE